VKLASVILLVALCGCLQLKGKLDPVYSGPDSCIYSNSTYHEVEGQLMYAVCALTAIQMYPNRAAEISDKALADYYKWQEKAQKRYDSRRK